MSLILSQNFNLDISNAVEPHKSRVLIFVKGSCPTCTFLLPFLQNYYKLQQKQDCGLYLISQDDENTTKAWMAAFEIGLPVILDYPEYTISRKFEFYAVPMIVSLSPQGKKVQMSEGFVKTEFEQIINEFVKKNALIPFQQFDEHIPVIKPG